MSETSPYRRYARLLGMLIALLSPMLFASYARAQTEPTTTIAATPPPATTIAPSTPAATPPGATGAPTTTVTGRPATAQPANGTPTTTVTGRPATAQPANGTPTTTSGQTSQRTADTPTDAGVSGQTPSTIDPGVLVFDNPVPASDSNSVSITIGDPTKPSQSVLIILLLTLLSVAPSLLILLTSFTRIAIVLSLVRNAVGLQSIPPNQVIVGLALFLSLFIMRPTFEKMNTAALQPLLKNEISQGDAYKAALTPLREFMLKQTGKKELKMMMTISKEAKPRTPNDVSTATLIPAFILSELRIAFIIGFIVFIPFLVIDLIVSSSLMSMGMMMLPPVVISLPFKLLLFVLVDGWSLVVRSLITSFN